MKLPSFPSSVSLCPSINPTNLRGSTVLRHTGATFPFSAFAYQTVGLFIGHYFFYKRNRQIMPVKPFFFLLFFYEHQGVHLLRQTSRRARNVGTLFCVYWRGCYGDGSANDAFKRRRYEKKNKGVGTKMTPACPENEGHAELPPTTTACFCQRNAASLSHSACFGWRAALHSLVVFLRAGRLA